MAPLTILARFSCILAMECKTLLLLAGSMADVRSPWSIFSMIFQLRQGMNRLTKKDLSQT
jgi:hypothetical protein